MNEQALRTSLALMGIETDIKTADTIWNVAASLIKNGEFGVVEAMALRGVIDQKYSDNIVDAKLSEEKTKEEELPSSYFMSVAREMVDESIKKS